jgi:pectate lyase-like protein
MKWIALIAVLLFSSAAHASCPAGSTCTQYNGTVPYDATGGNTARTPAARALDHGVNILEFGADPTGTNDSAAAIQSAIDYCSANDPPCRSTFCPDGTYKTSLPIFLDPPGNLRGADGTHGLTYAAGTTYVANQTVNYSGVAYISLVNNNIGNTPSSSPTKWQVFAYNSGTTYAQNAVVSYNGVPWLSLQGSNTGNTPGTSSAYWQLTTAAPINFGFSLSFFGNPGQGNGETNGGCVLKPQYTSGPAYWSGTGQGMTTASVQIQFPEAAYRGAIDPRVLGIAIAGGSGGASRTLIDNVEIDNVYTCIKTGANQDELADSNTVRKTSCNNCFNGFYVSATQNDINDAVETNFPCTNSFVAGVGPGISIWGGNPSSGSSQSNAFTISSVSALTAIAAGNSFNYSFTATIASPDSNITACPTNVGNCIYDSWIIVTPNFGPVPLTMTAYNTSTGVGTFLTWPNWGAYYFQFTSATSTTALQTDIEAATTIYAAERVRVLTGAAFQLTGMPHIENPAACTTFVQNGAGFSEDHGIVITHARFNYDPGLTQLNGGSPAQLAQVYCQAAFPFIDMQGGGNLILDNVFFSQSVSSNPVVIDFEDTTTRLIARGNTQLVNPTLRVTGSSGGYQGIEVGYISGGGVVSCTAGLGCGEWDQTPFQAANASAAAQIEPFQSGLGFTPYAGYRPAPWSHPRILAATYATLGSITSSNALGSYPIVDGSTIYSVLDPLGKPAGKFVQSEHTFQSYGQNLTTSNITGLSLSWQGQSFVVRADAGTCSWLYPGVAVYLNNGSGNLLYEVTGVEPNLSLDGGTHPCFFTVLNAQQDGSPYLLTGTKTTTYTATAIGQDSYSWKTLTLQ